MILVVEDEAISRRALVNLLSGSGYEARAVRSAEEAMECVGHGDSPDVALVDQNLPGMNGIDLIRCLEHDNPDMFPVLITAEARELIRNLDGEHPVTYMRKPINFHSLLRLIDHAKDALATH